MTSRIAHFIVISAATALVLQAAERPNILFSFFLDDWDRDAGIYKDPKRPGLNDVIETPPLDATGHSGLVVGAPVINCGIAS